MTRSRFTTLVAAATSAMLLLAACGQSPDDAANSLLQPPRPIRVANAPTEALAESKVAGADAVMTSMPAFAGYTFELGPDFPALPTQSTGYQYPANPALESEVVTRLAEALGVPGEPVAGGGPTVDGLRWRVGPDDGSAPSLTISDDAQLNFNYSPAWNNSTSPSVGCAESVSSDGAISEPTCPEPIAPVNVPTADEAEQLVTDLLVELDQDPEEFELETYADDYAASVTAWTELDGQRSPVAWGFGYGENGALQWMNGVLATPVAAGPYPLIGVDEALERLDEQTNWYRGGVFLDDTATTSDEFVGEGRATPAEAPAVAPTEPAPMPSETLPAPNEPPVSIPVDTVPVDTILVDPIPVDTVPTDTIPVEPMVATLVDVRADLWWSMDDDGSVWLIPAYSFTTSDDGVFTVPAVTDEFLVIVETPVGEPLPEPLPLPVEPPVSVVDADTSGIEGLGVEEAAALLESRGLSLRVVRENGVDLAITEDFNTSRVNVAVDVGVVTAVVSIG